MNARISQPSAHMFTARIECRDVTRGRNRTDHSMLIIAMIRLRLATECLQAESIMGYPPITSRSRRDNRKTLALIRDVRHHYLEHMWPLSGIARRRRFDRRHLLATMGDLRRAGVAEADASRTLAALGEPSPRLGRTVGSRLQAACTSPAGRAPPARRARREALGIPEGSIHYEWRSPVGWRIVVHVRSTTWQAARREPEKASRRT